MPAATITLCGVTYEVLFEKTAPSLTLTPLTASGASIDGRLECCGCNFAIFAFGGTRLCTDARDTTHKGCGNILRMKVELDCCPMVGWDGPGWYCVTSGTPPVNCTPVELLETDKCEALTICSGPHADYATALGFCAAPGASCCGGTSLALGTYVDRSVGNVVETYSLDLIPGHTYYVTYSYSTGISGGISLITSDCAGGSTTHYTSTPGTGAGISDCFEFTVPVGQPRTCVTWSFQGGSYHFIIREGSGHCPTCAASTALTLGTPATGHIREGGGIIPYRVTVSPSTAYKISVSKTGTGNVIVGFVPMTGSDCTGTVAGSGGNVISNGCTNFTTGPTTHCLCLYVQPAVSGVQPVDADYSLTVAAGTC